MDPLATLRDARKRHVPWRGIARHLLALERNSPLDGAGHPWIQSVAGVSGYSSNHLRRMTKALTAVEAIGSAMPDHAGRLDELSFSHAEVLARVWQTAPEQVRHLLSGKDWPSYPALLALYEKSRASKGVPSAAGKLAAAAFRTRVRALLAERLEGELVAPYLHYTYAKPTFLHLTPSPAITVHAAYDCLVVPEGVDPEPIHRRMVAWATESTFFKVYWLVISHRDGLPPIADGILTLGLQNVGVLQVEGSDLHVAYHPSGPPLPDRRGLYGEFMASHGSRILAKWRQGKERDSESEGALRPLSTPARSVE